MRKEDTIIFLLIWFAATLLACSFGLLIDSVSAAPYQLNLTDGTLIDLNTTTSADNLTIYIIHQNSTCQNINYNITNITYQNITYQNLTCYNCTYNSTYSNNTYYNYTINGSQFVYNKSDADLRFALISDLSSLRSDSAMKSDINSVNSRIDGINMTGTITKSSSSLLWIISIFALIIALICLFIIVRSG